MALAATKYKEKHIAPGVGDWVEELNSLRSKTAMCFLKTNYHFWCQASYSIALIFREAGSQIEPVRDQAEAIFRNIKD